MTSARALRMLCRDEQPNPRTATERAFERGLGDLAAIRLSPPADGELTQDLLYRPPIERKLSDEQSSNRLDTILADRNSDRHQPHDFALPLPMPLVGFRGALRVGDREVFPGQIG